MKSKKSKAAKRAADAELDAGIAPWKAARAAYLAADANDPGTPALYAAYVAAVRAAVVTVAAIAARKGKPANATTQSSFPDS